MKKIKLLSALVTLAISTHAQIPNIPDLDGKFQVNAINNLLNNTSNRSNRSNYTLFNNFPLTHSYGLYDPKGGVVTANLDSDNDLEIIYGCGPNLYGINSDGSIVSGWNKTYATGNDIIWPAAIGDIDGDNIDDVVVIGGSQSSGNLYAYDLNGNLKTGFPFTNIGVVPMMPVLGDIDKDGDDEIIFSKRLSGSAGGEVYVLKGDGTIFPGWPYSMGIGEFPGSSVAVGDINNNGTIEIVGESKNKLWAWNANGTVLNGFPFDLDVNNVIINSYSSPVLVDIDNDQQHEIIFCAHNPGGIIYVVKNDGTLYPGWPKTTTEWIYAPVIAIDINNDANMEIFVQDQIASSMPSSFIYGYDKNGNMLTGFPYGPMYGGLNQLTASDLDNDGDWELISDDNVQYTDTSGQYIAIHHNGTAFTDFPLVTKGDTYYKQIVLDDLNKDGMLDFIGSGVDLNTKTSYLHAWNTSISFVSQKTINPFFQLNKKHDNYYPLPIGAEIADKKREHVLIYPNPFLNQINIESTEPINEILIKDVQGRTIYKTTDNRNNISFPLHNLAPGVYIISVKYSKGAITYQQMIKHE